MWLYINKRQNNNKENIPPNTERTDQPSMKLYLSKVNRNTEGTKPHINNCLQRLKYTGMLVNMSRHRKMATILQTTFSNTFSWMKICEFRLIFDDRPLYEPITVRLMMNKWVTRPHWVKISRYYKFNSNVNCKNWILYGVTSLSH